MLKHRLIPVLLIKNGRLVKSLRFKNCKYVGDPINAVRIFNEKEVDELIVLDIAASKEGAEPDFGLIEEFASECFMPLAYGGGIKTVEQADRLFGLGVEKVCLQTAVLEDLSLVTTFANRYGSQSVVVSVDVKRNLVGRLKLYSASFERTLPQPWLQFAFQAQQAGAGEILINAVHQDGTMKGPDLSMITEAANSLSVPLIAVGGISSFGDIKNAVNAGASAIGAGAYFVFQGPHRAVLITYPNSEDLDKLFRKSDNTTLVTSEKTQIRS